MVTSLVTELTSALRCFATAVASVGTAGVVVAEVVGTEVVPVWGPAVVEGEVLCGAVELAASAPPHPVRATVATAMAIRMDPLKRRISGNYTHLGREVVLPAASSGTKSLRDAIGPVGDPGSVLKSRRATVTRQSRLRPW
jgi:hypothetical protein